ncbi:MAG: ShlB/FhaC/HecB family hemolysin secretion/activation protein [Gammaproteobacteria bacterium]|nr:ShlB/FhaC/HecB family hemolysin secretion/activation protein [Gammaproteobacteria bacterium]
MIRVTASIQHPLPSMHFCSHGIPFCLFLVVFLVFNFPAMVFGQSAVELGIEQSEQLLREEQRRLKMLERARLLRELERSLFPIEISPLAPKDEGASTDTCFTITRILLEGADNLFKSEKKALTQPYLNRCLNLNDIDALRTDIDRFYIEKGWIMSRAYLQPNQNIKNGVLQFRVLEGKLESIELNQNDPAEMRQISTAFPDMLEQIIHIRDIEQGLDQMNRLASNRATMNIEPAKDKPGYSKILIQNTPTNRHRIYFSIDNQGSKSTGRERARITANLDNLLSLNDNWYLSATDYIGGEEDKQDSRGYSFVVSIPYGFWTYSLGSNQSEYISAVDSGGVLFNTSGDSNNDSLKVSRIAHRDQNSKTTLSLTLTAKEPNSYLEDVRLDSSSPKLSVFDIGVNHSVRNRDSTWSLLVSYSRGLGILGALEDGPDSSNTIPKAQFERLGWDILLSLPIKSWGKDWSYQGSWSGQVSSDPLFASEQISIGDLSSVRGFRDSPVSGDSGLYFRNDISWDLSSRYPVLKNMAVAAGLDFGYVVSKDNNIANSGVSHASLAGLALSVNQAISLSRRQQLFWSITLGIPVSAPAFVEEEGNVIYFNLDWKVW